MKRTTRKKQKLALRRAIVKDLTVTPDLANVVGRGEGGCDVRDIVILCGHPIYSA